MDNKSWLQEWGWEPRRYKITLIGWVLVSVMALPAALFFGVKGMLILAFPVIFAVLTVSVYGTVGGKGANGS